jgi:hypothetical protein
MKGAVGSEDIWVNPDALVFLDAKDDKGATIHWSVELGSPLAIALKAGTEAR